MWQFHSFNGQQYFYWAHDSNTCIQFWFTMYKAISFWSYVIMCLGVNLVKGPKKSQFIGSQVLLQSVYPLKLKTTMSYMYSHGVN